MMQDWNAYRAALKERVGDFASLNPDVRAGLATIEGAAAKTGHLEPKMHELIALAVAVTTRCDGCISVHTQKAVQYGATREEISEALGVAIALNAGAALVYSARALDTHAQLPTRKPCGGVGWCRSPQSTALPIFEEHPCSSMQISRCARW
jgi:AhpD family alkylhydroperoxidase